jgi:hypothetical protein
LIKLLDSQIVTVWQKMPQAKSNMLIGLKAQKTPLILNFSCDFINLAAWQTRVRAKTYKRAACK